MRRGLSVARSAPAPLPPLLVPRNRTSLLPSLPLAHKWGMAKCVNPAPPSSCYLSHVCMCLSVRLCRKGKALRWGRAKDNVKLYTSFRRGAGRGLGFSVICTLGPARSVLQVLFCEIFFPMNCCFFIPGICWLQSQRGEQVKEWGPKDGVSSAHSPVPLQPN